MRQLEFRVPALSERESPVRGRAGGRHGGIDADNDEPPVLTGGGELCKYWSATGAGPSRWLCPMPDMPDRTGPTRARRSACTDEPGLRVFPLGDDPVHAQRAHHENGPAARHAGEDHKTFNPLGV
jgi:hypothetical protein